MKLMITAGVFVGGTVGGYIGALADNGNWLGGWSILLSGVGSLAGIWVAYKASQYFGN
jgi:hypothetical protein